DDKAIKGIINVCFLTPSPSHPLIPSSSHPLHSYFRDRETIPMIIETKDDVVQLSGSLHKNQWMTIKAAVNLLLHEHPQGIIVDCAHLETISEDGAKTFLEAMRDIEAAKSRIVFASLPDHI